LQWRIKKFDMTSPLQHWVSSYLVVESEKHMVNNPLEGNGSLCSWAAKLARNEIVKIIAGSNASKTNKEYFLTSESVSACNSREQFWHMEMKKQVVKLFFCKMHPHLYASSWESLSPIWWFFVGLCSCTKGSFTWWLFWMQTMSLSVLEETWKQFRQNQHTCAWPQGCSLQL
jgi:hypothetical protein